MPRPLQPALHFLNLSGGNSVIVDNTGFKIPNLAGSEVQDSVSDLTDNLSVLIEQLYFDKLTSAARLHGWPFRPALLAGDETGKPTVEELLAASEAVLLTSIQEGFGLPFGTACAVPTKAAAVSGTAGKCST